MIFFPQDFDTTEDMLFEIFGRYFDLEPVPLVSLIMMMMTMMMAMMMINNHELQENLRFQTNLENVSLVF